MPVVLQGGECRQCELPGAFPRARPMARGRTDQAPQSAPAHPGCTAPCCPHAESCRHTLPACSSPRRFFTPARVLRSLTAQAPVEMHQKPLSNKLILVQSCHRRFCCSACHNLLRLVQPRRPPRAAQQPAACAQPPDNCCGCGSAAALQPQVRSGLGWGGGGGLIMTFTLAGEALKAPSSAGLSGEGLVLPGWGMELRWVPCAMLV